MADMVPCGKCEYFVEATRACHRHAPDAGTIGIAQSGNPDLYREATWPTVSKEDAEIGCGEGEAVS
jgi:hypothetical protein